MTLIRQTHLDEAVASGTISADEARALVDLAAKNRVPARAAQERITLFRNFNEIFVSIGLLMLIGAAVALLSSLVERPDWPKQPEPDVGSALVAAVAAAVAFGLGELLSRRHMTAPAIISVLASAYFAGAACSLALFGRLDWVMISWGSVLWQSLVAALLVVGLGLARVRLPFLVLPLVIGLVNLTFQAAQLLWERGGRGAWLVWTPTTVGLVLTAIAVWRDWRDPDRVSRASQYALWLYLVALPLVLFWPLAYLFHVAVDVDRSALVAALVIGLMAGLAFAVTLFGLLFDRRTPVIATVLFVTFVVRNILQRPGASNVLVYALILATIGCYVVIVGVRWRQLRRALFAHLPNWAFLRRLPPVSPDS